MNGSSQNWIILTWKSGEKIEGNHFILLNPNDVKDYVEFDFNFIKKYAKAELITSIFFDGTGFYLMTSETIRNPKEK